MKLNLLPKTNIEEVLIKERLKGFHPKDTYQSVEDLIHELDIKTQNDFIFDKIETKNIFHLNDIKNVCISYRLRFLDIKYFKGELPESAHEAIEMLEEKHDTILSDYKIMAPSVLFRLAKQDDPLLFVPMGNQYYYLVHKWGNDLQPMRKLLMWPFRNIWNLLLTLLGISWIATEFTPMSIFTKTPDSAS